MSASAGEGQGPRPAFRSFDAEEFRRTPSWIQLAGILTGNGGAFAIYGPRGSGTSWLMLRAVHGATEEGGIGLWFPCPSNHDASELLSALSDNLASAVERRFAGDARQADTRGWQIAVGGLAIILFLAQLASSVIHGGLSLSSLFSLGALWLWIVVAVLAVTFYLISARQAGAASLPERQLARQATGLRERIRYSTALKLGTEASISGGGAGRLGGSVTQRRETSLNERPTTVASLVFEFRALAERIVAVVGKPVVIGIDDLDKADPRQVRRLLADIRGIFEISGVHFLVAVSEEVAAALHLGPLQGKGRAEFSGAFHTVIELPPLSPGDVAGIVADRTSSVVSERRAQLLCLLSAGSWHEVTRLADRHATIPDAPGTAGQPADFRLVTAILAAEKDALQRDIIRAHDGSAEADKLLDRVWKALPAAAFKSLPAFGALGKSAIRLHWSMPDATKTWEEEIREPWRRFLIRLFVISQVAVAMRLGGGTPAIDAEGISDLRDVLMMAGQSTSVANLMLEARYGEQLDRPYAKPGN
jgi:hypothetical protein